MAKPTLLERITTLRAEIDDLLDQYAEQQKVHAQGIPHGVLRALLTNRAPGCQCSQAILLEKEKA